MSKLYLDNHTTTQPCDEAIEAMVPFLKERWGLPSAPHARGQVLLPAMREAYDAIYALLGAREPDNVILTSSGVEAVNQVVWAAYLDVARQTGKNHFVTTALDEAPVIMAYERLEEMGCDTTLVPVNEQGIITAEALGDAITLHTALVSISWANALTGVVQPVIELSEVCRERGILFHLEASHVLGKLDFDLDEIAPDLVSFNGDHIHAPVGTGALWIRSGLRLSPLLCGGLEQDGYRGGPVSVPLLVALGAAAKEALAKRDHVATEVARLRHKLETELGAQVFFQDAERTPHTTTLAFPGVTSDALLYSLDSRGICASFGGGQYQQLALQLAATGVERPLADCAVSLSLSRMTTETEIDQAIEQIQRAASELRKLSEALVS